MKKLFINAVAIAAFFFCQTAAAQKMSGASLNITKGAKAQPPARVWDGLVVSRKTLPPCWIDLYWSGAFYASKNCEGGAEDNSYAFSHGLKLGFGALDARLFNSCKKTSGADLWAIDSFGGYEEVFKNRRWSVSLDLSKFSSEVGGTVAFGSLRFYSQKRLAPFSVAVSPFVSSLGDAGALKASLPTKSSGAQDDAVFVAASFKTVEKFSTEKIRLMPLRAEFAISKNEADPEKAPFLLGLSGGFFYQNFFKLTSGFLFRRYYYQEEAAAASVDWIEEIPVWKSQLMNAGAFDIVWEIPYLKSRATFGIAQSAQSLGRWTAAQEFLATVKNFSLAAAVFASDNLFCGSSSPYVAASARECKKLWQAKIAPQIEFKAKNGAQVKIGAAALLEEQIKDWQKKTERNSLESRFAAGFQIYGKENSFRLVGTSGAAVLREDPPQESITPLPKASATAAFSHKFAGGSVGGRAGRSGAAGQKGSVNQNAAANKKSLAGQNFGGRITVSCGVSFQPEFEWEKREWTERAKIAWYPRGLVLQSVWLACSASQKELKYKFEPSAAAAFLFRLKTLRLNASLTATFPLGW